MKKRNLTNVSASVHQRLLALTDDFSTDAVKQVQWQAFLRKGRLEAEAKTLAEIVSTIADFLLPATYAAAAGNPFDKRWPPGGNWQ